MKPGTDISPHTHSNGTDQNPLKAVKNREKFADGSELVELMNGAFLIMEGNSKAVPIFAEQPAPYDQPAPMPKAINYRKS
jgi:hypothetical protein